MTNSNNRSKNTLLLVAGALAGAAATYYLNTPKGKQMRSDVASKSRDISNTVIDKVSTTATNANARAQEALVSATNTLASAKETLLDKTTSMLGSAEKEVGEFQTGINKAKQSIKNGVAV